MIPDGLHVDACGITAKGDARKLIAQYPQLADFALIRNSDAHYPDDIGSGYTEFYLDQPTVPYDYTTDRQGRFCAIDRKYLF